MITFPPRQSPRPGDSVSLLSGSSVRPPIWLGVHGRRTRTTPACSSRRRSSWHPARTPTRSSRWQSSRDQMAAGSTAGRPAMITFPHWQSSPSGDSVSVLSGSPVRPPIWLGVHGRRTRTPPTCSSRRRSSRPAKEADGFSEDTDPLIEVAVVPRSRGPRIIRRPSRYDHLPALAVVPLRRFCEPVHGVNFITPAPSSRYWENSPSVSLSAS